jgi:biopolymer transport protein ExbB
MMGTVVGMIRAFGSVAKAKAMTPEAVAGGIAEALLCTAGGLIVAALTTVEYNYFTTRVNRFVLQVQAAATKLVERVLNAQVHKADKSRTPIASRPAPAPAAGGAAK